MVAVVGALLEGRRRLWMGDVEQTAGEKNSKKNNFADCEEEEEEEEEFQKSK